MRDAWGETVWSELLLVAEHGPDVKARPGPDGLSAAEARTALGPGQAVLPPRSLLDALDWPDEVDQPFRLAVPIRNRAGELFALDFQLSTYAGGSARLLRVLRADEAAANLLARAETLVAEREWPPIAPPPLPDPRRTADVTPPFRWRAADATATRSRIAGVPFAPPDFEWPRRRSGRPLAYLAQIDLAELPPSDLPRDGVLAFFYDVELMPAEEDDTWHVTYWPATEPLSVTQPPSDLDPPELAPQRGLVPLPDDDERMRMLGEPDAIRWDPREEDGSVLVMQFDSGPSLDVDFVDAGRLYFLIAPDDLAAHRFDRVRAELQFY